MADLPDHGALGTRWSEMDAEKGTLVTRSEEYAALTIPSICPPETALAAQQQQVLGRNVVRGPVLVNHLANKVAAVVFPYDRPFFTVGVGEEAKMRMRKELGSDGLSNFLSDVRPVLADVEKAGMGTLNLTHYRPKAILAVKHLIVTGNALIRRTDDAKRVVYGIRSFCVRRDIDGAPYEVMLRRKCLFSALPVDVRTAYMEKHPGTQDRAQVSLYTHYVLDQDGRWLERMAVDDVPVGVERRHTKEDFPCVVLAWTLAENANYGTGLVEDNVTGLRLVDILTTCMIEGIAIMADIKFFVRPGSVTNVADLYKAARGAYVQGDPDDIGVPDIKRDLRPDVVASIISDWERTLSQAFLYNTGTVRDAERVTAEEIRYVAEELEASYGGLYAMLSEDWQKREAEHALSKVGFNRAQQGSGKKLYEAQITTGLESLSRQGQLANTRAALNDLAQLDTVPEDIRISIDPLRFATFVFTNHNVPAEEIVRTRTEIEQEQNREVQIQTQLAQQQAAAQADGALRQEAGMQAMKETR